ncbi:MAG: 4Fe-4S binding protein [Anaerolineae bacterium]|jgi:ferredoxin|nr:4Fe-4S binding protein [Anaerolineae bacterium]
MASTTSTYTERRPLRRLERLWTRGEGYINWLAAAFEPLRPFNPLYHLGPLVIFLLILLCVTGILLLLLYRPGMDRAYESVAAISGGWLGSVVRSVHRYGSDALIVVAFLHALKMLLSDRFSGSRALAWVSGWLLVVLFWITGSMGYFLVWDAAAQWLTEFAVDAFGGAFALSFFGPQAAGRTYSFFVIILFLHAFLPLIIAIGILVHVLRLQRPRYWAPRWLMIASTAVLVLLSVIWPVMSNMPADLRAMLPSARLDWWYMGFLPLSERLGQPGFWGVSLALLGLVSALPWLLRARHHGPSAVDESRCTGCATCARECPYNAIEMVSRNGGGKGQVAQVRGNLCVGCGICVAACPEDAIDLARLEMGALRRQVCEAVAAARAHGHSPLLVYACDRHATLGSLPALASGRSAAAPRVQAGAWPGDGRAAVSCALPCLGSLQPSAVAEALDAGAGEVLLVACPAGDCGFREGSRWLEERVAKRPPLQNARVRLLAAAPGTRVRPDDSVPFGLPRPAASAQSWIVALVVLTLLFGAAILANRPTPARAAGDAQIRLAINHHGELLANARELPPDVVAKLPPGVDPALVLGGERVPVRLQVTLDGETLVAAEYRAGGLRREGSVYGLETVAVAPGARRLVVTLSDDGGEPRVAFDAVAELVAGKTLVLVFDPVKEVFEIWE